MRLKDNNFDSMKARFLAGLVLLVMALTSCDETTETIGSSLTDNMDFLKITTDSFRVTSRSIIADSVLSRNAMGYLGRIKDPETGAYVTGDFMVQFNSIDTKAFPVQDSIMSRINGKVVADSCIVNLYYSNFFGDSLSTMKLTAYEMAKPLEENQMYYSNYDPFANGYIREDGIKVDKVFTLADQNVDDSLRTTTDFLPSIHLALNDPYTDSDGKTYNNFGTYVMRKYFENPNYFKNSYQFVHHVCPGFYVKIKDGTGAMAYVNISWMVVYFKIKDEDGNEEVGRTSFSGTEEVLQTTRITNDQRSIERLVSDNSCTYIKSPAGIFTELTLPVDEIINNHENDTLNTARLSLTKMIDWSDSDYKFNMPTYLLMVPKDSLYTFFEKNSLPNNITSYVKERDHTSISTGSSYYSQRVIKKYKDSYTFDNISNLIRHMAETKKKGGSDYTIKHPNWNKVVIVPVTVNTTTTTSGGTAISRVMNDMSPTSLRLVGGSENVNGDIHISVIYSKFSNK